MRNYGIRCESVDSFSDVSKNNTRAHYVPVLFCCQGNLHCHYRQPRTDNRPDNLVRTTPCFYVSLCFAGYPCWRVFLAFWTIAGLFGHATVQSEDNLVQGCFDQNFLMQGHSAATGMQSIDPVGFGCRLASNSIAETKVWLCTFLIDGCTDWPL